MAIPVVCITGGPCAGKTSVIEAIRQEFADSVITIPETATTLLNSYPLPGKDLIRDEAWLSDFQKPVIATQVAVENKWKEVAKAKKVKLVVADRGLLDSVAYLPGGERQFTALAKMPLDEAFQRYDMVIHLESLATCNPDKFGKSGNAVRYETLDEAIALEQAIRLAWSKHPNWQFISGADGLADVIAQVFDLIAQYFFVEIEKKFLLPTVPMITFPSAPLIIEQWYLIKDPVQVRVRREGNKTTLTVKGKGLVSRKEWEKTIPWSLFSEVTDQMGPSVKKLRYILEENGRKWELDVYSGDLSGLVTVECEVEVESALDDLVLPSWMKGAVDVTEVPELKNEALAANGLPNLSKYF